MRFDWIRFQADETGAVTVDWVVLTAALIGIGILVLIPIAYGTDNAAQTVGTAIGSVTTGVWN